MPIKEQFVILERIKKKYKLTTRGFIETPQSSIEKREMFSQYKGVLYSKAKHRIMSVITKKGKRYFCGYHDTEESAAHAYDKKSIELNGDKAKLNFPLETYIKPV